MTTVEVVLPERVLDRVGDGLVELTERIDAIDPDSVVHGFLGGQHGYGAHWDNAVFQMRPYCWCEREDCAWCGGCNCNTVHTVDGRDVTFDEWMAFFQREVGAAPHGQPRAFKAWEVRAEEVNRRRGHRVEGETCDYCAGRGVFATNGAEPGKGAPNFWHKPSGFKVWWYKYIGRGMETVGEPRPGTIAECIASLTAAASAGDTAAAAETGTGSVHEHAAPSGETPEPLTPPEGKTETPSPDRVEVDRLRHEAEGAAKARAGQVIP